MTYQLALLVARVSRGSMFAWTFALTALILLAAPMPASAQTAVTKWLCSNYPGSSNATCAAGSVASAQAGLPVYYVVVVKNPTAAAISVQLNDTYPADFVSGPVDCTDSLSGQVYSTTVSALSLSTSVQVPAATSLTSPGLVTCTIEGVFTRQSNAMVNSGTAQEPNGPLLPFSYQSIVTNNLPVNADLSITKTAAPQNIDVSGGPAVVTYRITIKNNGPADIDIGPFFQLHDTFALMPSSVPLDVKLLPGQTCQHIPIGDCLLPATQNLTGPAVDPYMVQTAAAQSFADWNFGSQLGHMAVGDTIVLKYQVQVSRVPWIACVKAPNSDGLINNAFFDLARVNGSTLTELVPADNISSSNPPGNNDSKVNVFTGYYVTDPSCASTIVPPPLSIKKVQITPTPTGGLPWPSLVMYQVKIKNMSATQTVSNIKFSDSVEEGLGTPPFTESTVSCSATPPCLGTPVVPPHNFTYYTEQFQIWNPPVTGGLVLGPNGSSTDSVTYLVGVRYSDPSCDSVPVIPAQLILNIASVSYTALQLNGTGTPYSFNQQDYAKTHMHHQPPCNFVVRKKLISGGPNVHFSGPPGPAAPPLEYTVSFKNNDPVIRSVGTVIDTVRLTVQSYASSLPYNATYNCTPTGSIGNFGPMNGAVSGNAVYTTLPSQGARIINNGIGGGPVVFGAGASLTCDVKIWVHPPPASNPFCYAGTSPWADWENTAVMDISNRYDPNLPWPPTNPPFIYVNGAPSNPPTVPGTNWATSASHLPRCYNFTLSKFPSNPGIGLPAWTSAPNAVPTVSYSINATNVGPAAIPPGGGVNVTDLSPTQGTLNPPAHTQTVTALTPGQTFTMNAGLVGPLPQSNLVYQDTNCVQLQATGVLATADWYAAWSPSAQPPAPVLGNVCANVPVVPTSTLHVFKTIANHTGIAISIPSALSFTTQVACGTYQIPPVNPTLTAGPLATMPNGTSTTGAASNVLNVPVGDNCTVTETNPLPALPPGAVKGCLAQGGSAYWDTPSVAPSPVTISGSAQNNVTVTNTIRCKIVSGDLSVYKTFVNATGSPSVFGPLTFNVLVSCTPAPVSSNLTLMTPATSGTSVSAPGVVPNIPVNDSCTVTETPPPLPIAAQKWCDTHGAQAVWDTVISPSSVNPPNTATLQNTLRCTAVRHGELTFYKNFIDSGPGIVMPSASLYTINSNCTPQPSAPAGVTIASGQSSSVYVPVGESCSPTETPPPVPPSADRWCSSNGAAGTAHWITTMTPVPPIVVTAAGPNTVNVTNQLICNSQLSVTKTVNPDPKNLGGTLIFPISATCTNPTASYPFNVHGNSSTVPITAQFGSQCQFSEGVLPALPAGCTWLTPQFSPQPLTFGPGLNQEMVTNGYTCQTQLGSVQTNKIVTGSPAPAGTIFTFHAQCSSGFSGSFNITANGGVSFGGQPYGTTCTITEPTLPPPFTDAQGQTCTWHQTPPLSQTVTVTGVLVGSNVTNYYTCP